MKNVSGIVIWYSAYRIPGILSVSSNISLSLIFILNSKIALVFETELLNWTANEESSRRVGKWVFIQSRFMVSAAGDFVYAKFSEINFYNSTFLLFFRQV